MILKSLEGKHGWQYPSIEAVRYRVRRTSKKM